jgi:hypothetical protein
VEEALTGSQDSKRVAVLMMMMMMMMILKLVVNIRTEFGLKIKLHLKKFPFMQPWHFVLTKITI